MADALSRDPYKDFRFRVHLDGLSSPPVAGINQVGGLSWSVDVVKHGVTKLPAPGKQYPPVTLSRGITANEKFKIWASTVWNWKKNPKNPLKGLRKLVYIVLCDANGNAVMTYQLNKCWVSSYETLPELSSDGNSVAIEQITLEYQGWTEVPKDKKRV